jgi:hypothetical protein
MSGHDAGRLAGADKPAEPDDPMVLSRAYVPEALDAMSETVVQEFAQIGMPAEKIFRLFKSPFFSGTHRYYRLRGKAATLAMIARVLERAPVLRYRIKETNHD